MSETPDHLTLSGRFERKLFHDPQQNFLIGKMRLQSGVSITVTGNLFGMGEPRMGDVLTAHGNWVVHPTRGRQFQAMTISSPPQVTPKGFYAWLSRGAVDGVGKATVDALESEFGDEILTYLDQPERMAERAKITAMRAQAIAEGWNIASKNPLEETFIWLIGYGVKSAHARKIVTRYGIETRATVEANPWRLADEIEGIGFETADKLALAMGRTEADAQRVHACLYHVIEQGKRDGHWGLPIADLKTRTARLVGASEATVMEVIKAAVADQKLIWDNEFKPGLVRTPFQVKVEEQIASILVDAILTPLDDVPDDQVLMRHLDQIVEEMQDEMEKPDFSFNDQQTQAILMAVKNRVLVITGGPGVGKTTIQKGIIRLMNRIDDEIEIARAAPTGRAAKRMTEAAPHERADVAQTLHRLLGYIPYERRDAKGKVIPPGFALDENTPLNKDVLLADEWSMADMEMTWSILRAIDFQRTRLIMTGDPDQLPSVGPGRILKDLIDSGIVPVARLNRVYRRVKGGGIGAAAHAINNGEIPENDDNGEFVFINEPKDDDIVRNVVELVTEKLPGMGFDPVRDIQVLSPMYRGQAGITALNAKLKDILNPVREDTPVFMVDERVYSAGDKVIQLDNNHDEGVMNGDIGYIQEVIRSRNGKMSMVIDFSGIVVTYGPDKAGPGQLALAYAMSGHKSQGGEFPVAICPMSNDHYAMHKRNLIYTEVTRGKKHVFVVGSQRALKTAVETPDGNDRHSRLAARLVARFEAAQRHALEVDQLRERFANRVAVP